MRKALVFLALAVAFGAESEAFSPYSSMSCYKLWHARNSIYAKEGYCFSSPKAISVFGKACFPPYGKLSDWEAKEVEKIKRWEGRKGCSGNYVAPMPIKSTVAPIPSSTTSKSNETNNNILGYAKVVGVRPYSFLAVRIGPGKKYAQIGIFRSGDKDIQVMRCLGGWCKVRYKNIVGWVASRYLRMY